MTSDKIWREYQKGVNYNSSIGLYDRVRKNENFYIGKQWEGLDAPDLNKPVINVLKRVVSYFVSMIVSDDIGVSLDPFIPEQSMISDAGILAGQISQAMELADVKGKCRQVVRDAAVDGDGYMYFYYDPDFACGQQLRGGLRAQVLENTNVIYGNPYSYDLQNQPYVMISMRLTPDEVRREALAYGGDADEIKPDSDANRYTVNGAGADGLTTVVLKMWKENGRVYAAKACRDGMVRPAWDTGYSLYPLACMRWERVKNSYHGAAALTSAIPNQISINQLFAMGIHSVKATAFPKIIFDRTKLSGWSGKIGQAIGVVGNPNDAIAASFRGGDMSPQVMELIERLTQKTLEFMGASDSALGMVTPDNTSAIIATQKASAMPLELQKLEYYSFVEDCVRVMLDIICTDYGVRRVSYTQDGNTVVHNFDLSAVDATALQLKVDIGAASYWSELMQLQTLDNLFKNGIITDAVTYLESIPDGYIKGKSKLIEKLKAGGMNVTA